MKFRSAMHLLALCCMALWSGVFSPLSSNAQGPSSKALEFEVATVKPDDMSPGVMHHISTNVLPSGRVTITSFTLKGLICAAFDIPYWQLSGGDEWMTKQFYDVEADPPQTDPPTIYNVRHSLQAIEDPRLKKMLQALLIQRFNLKFHSATTPGTVFLLERTGKKTPLTAVDAEAGTKMYAQGYADEIGFGGNRWGLYNASMAELASFSSTMVNSAVIDRTGLDGAFNYRWTVIDADERASADQFMATRLQTFPLFLDAMGLKLIKSTGDVPTFVIDHAEPPSPN